MHDLIISKLCTLIIVRLYGEQTRRGFNVLRVRELSLTEITANFLLGESKLRPTV